MKRRVRRRKTDDGILATVLGVCFVALVMLSLCRAAARADAMAQHDWRVFCDEKARKARGQ